MARVNIHSVEVHFGDCDPAGIVFYPNFQRWMDQSSLAYFRACGLPPWREMERTRNIIGTPLLEIHTRFIQSATYGDVLEVHTSIGKCSGKVFEHQHRILRGGELLCEGTEKRAFVIRNPAEGGRLRAIPIPEDVMALCL